MLAIARYALILSLFAGPALAQDAATPTLADSVAQLQAFQSEVGDAKHDYVGKLLTLTDAEAAKFWPVFDAHQAALAKLNQRRLANIHAYAKLWNEASTDDKAAAAVAKEALAIEAEEAALLQRSFAKLKTAMPVMKAIRYLQFESKLRAIIKFELAAEIPLAKR
jgi:Spy/CpxP family protein refolding chaperone